jgi:hypothetical protein
MQSIAPISGPLPMMGNSNNQHFVIIRNIDDAVSKLPNPELSDALGQG